MAADVGGGGAAAFAAAGAVGGAALGRRSGASSPNGWSTGETVGCRRPEWDEAVAAARRLSTLEREQDAYAV